MNRIHIVDAAGFYIETKKVPNGIEILGSVSTDIPATALANAKAWCWNGAQWIQAKKVFIAVVERKQYSQDDWVIKNGFTGYKILAAAKNDSLAQFFYESMKAAPHVVMGDERLSIAYGYFVGAGYITNAEANAICETEVTPLTSELVAALMGAV
jgi:hypothetical protein